MSFVKKKILNFFKSNLKKILYFFGWRLEKIYVQKETVWPTLKTEELMALKSSNGIFHLGAHRGQEAPIYDWFGKKVIWIEANPSIFLDLKINIKKFIKQKCFCYLITNKTNQEYEFKISNNDGASSSIFDFGELSTGKKNIWPEKKALIFNEKIKLKSISIDDFVEKHSINISEYNHWVLDLQGSELLGLQGAIKSLKHCNSLLVEVSRGEIYKNGPQYDELKKFLSTFNFFPSWELQTHHDNMLFKKK